MPLHILFTGGCLFALFFGIGLLIRPHHLRTSHDPVLAFWVGYAVSIALLQLWHLVLPVGLIAFLLLALLGAAGIIIQRRHLRQALTQRIRVLPFVLLLLPVALWITHYAIHNPTHYDDGLYHAQELIWTQSYPIVPGLGNIHGRLAFNNAAALIMAVVDSVQVFVHPRYVVNGLLLLVFIGQALCHGWQFIRTPSLYHAVYLLFLAPALYFADSLNISSLKNDLPVSLLSIIVAAELVAIVQNPPEQAREQRSHRVLIMTLLVCGVVTIKLSGAILGGLLLFALLVHLFTQYRTEFVPALRMMTVVLIGVIGIWMLRGVILSGYPLYPLDTISLPVEWRMDEATVQQEADGVRSWARTPDADPKVVLASWDWLPGWWQRNQSRPVELVVPLVLAMITLVLAAGAVLYRRSVQQLLQPPLHQPLPPLRNRQWLLIVPILPAVVFWFLNAPDTRFGWHNLWLMGVMLFLIALSILRSSGVLRTGVLITSIVLVVIVAIQAVNTEDLIGDSEQLFPPVPTQNFYSYHGVKLHVPIHNPQCWDAAEPCTPYPNYLLAQRNLQEVREGFKLAAAETDKAAFSLVEIVQEPDIVPAVYVQQLKGGELPTDGLLVGRGWHSLESWGEGQREGRHRWVENNAEIYITNATGQNHRVQLEIEPGPSLDNQPFELLVLNEKDEQVASTEVRELQTVEFDLPLTEERVQIFRLCIETEGEPAPDDGRILNFRVTQIQWG